MGISPENNMSSIDPVCGLEILPTGKNPSEVIKGHTYYFCTEKCRNTFNDEPSKYIDILNFFKSDKAWRQKYMHEI
jgi:YHS domain-containing protein